MTTCPDRSRRVPAALLTASPSTDADAELAARASALRAMADESDAGVFVASARGGVASGSGVSIAGAIRETRAVSAEGADTRHSGTASAVTGTRAAAAIAHVQRKWRAEADARRMAMVSTHARARTRLARTQKPSNRGIRSVDTSGSFLAGALDHGS